MFIGRDKELTALTKLYNSNKFEFAVIYGRRRIGKTYLINEFIKNKKAISFTGIESNEMQNLENFSKSIFEYNVGLNINSTFASFQSAFEFVFELSKKERIILVIDEYPYVAKSASNLASTLQYLIDKNINESKLMLILCGSSMSYMEDNVLSYKSPLYGRRTAQFKIEPFAFFELKSWFKNFNEFDLALVYGLVGGTPLYLKQINDDLSIEENIKNIFLNPNSFLFEEPSNLLKQEVREPANYNAIVAAIACGNSKMNEISNKIGEETSVCATYIKNLISLGIIKKELPFLEKSSRKTIYSIEDNMFRFWYRFVFNNISLISKGATEVAYSRIEPNLSDYMGEIFEEICKQYLWKLLIKNECKVKFIELSRWWGTNNLTHKQEEIDIMGEDNNSFLFGECKWKNEKVDVSILEKLLCRGKMFDFKEKVYYIFSKSGFTVGCEDMAKKMDNVFLIDFKDMFK